MNCNNMHQFSYQNVAGQHDFQVVNFTVNLYESGDSESNQSQGNYDLHTENHYNLLMKQVKEQETQTEKFDLVIKTEINKAINVLKKDFLTQKIKTELQFQDLRQNFETSREYFFSIFQILDQVKWQTPQMQILHSGANSPFLQLQKIKSNVQQLFGINIYKENIQSPKVVSQIFFQENLLIINNRNKFSSSNLKPYQVSTHRQRVMNQKIQNRVPIQIK